VFSHLQLHASFVPCALHYVSKEYRNKQVATPTKASEHVAKYADTFWAMVTGPQLCDPAADRGSEKERPAVFGRLRDQIREYLRSFPPS
jgi:hypothetical protein